jgi:uncharacterized protein YggT (Ycf19 family)
VTALEPNWLMGNLLLPAVMLYSVVILISNTTSSYNTADDIDSLLYQHTGRLKHGYWEWCALKQ